jgi:hypothetical protein
MLRRAAHRVRQFFGALRPRVTAEQRERAYSYLDEPHRRIFESMTLRDQQHGIDVFERVRGTAGEDPHLLTAALLHDCGKGRVYTWQRVAFVVLSAAAPPLLRRIAAEDGADWRSAFWRLLHHPALGANMVAAAGGHLDVVRMIREQDAARPDPRLALLQAADEA